tara:strand:- start:361 stop:1257 length:897 start_codon:yes stop_codon:yes gene_type:complete
MAIGNYSHSRLLALIRQQQEATPAGEAGGSNTQLQFNNNGALGGIPQFTFDGSDMKVADGRKIFFGDSGDSYVHYRSADEFMTISGSAKGIALSGTTIQIDGTLEGASPLKIGGAIQFVGSEGDASAFNFGPNNEAKLFFDSADSGVLVVSGSGTSGLILSGSAIHIDKFLSIGTREATHAITLPDTSNASGKVKANAFVSYSSIRYKKDVQPLESAVGTISKLQGVSYNWKDTGKKDFGFIAEDVGKVIPEIVEWSQDPQYANTMDYTRIISFLVEAVKEQQKKIDLLTEKIDKLDV